MTKHIYAPDTTLAADDAKVRDLVGAARGTGAMLDSASAASVDTIKLALADATNLLPARMNALIEKLEDEKTGAIAVGCMLDGIRRFESEHGYAPSADMIDAALAQALAVADGKATNVLPNGMMLDSVSNSLGSTSLSHQPNRIAVAIVAGLTEAVPFGAYLPSDLGSGESKLSIINSQAGSNFGSYKDGDILDGVNGAQPFLMPERTLTAVQAGDRLTATAAFKAKTDGSGANLPLLRNRTKVVINGFAVAREIDPNSTSATPQIAGQVVIAGNTYAINGTVTPADGSVALTFNPALPVNTVVQVVAFVNYEGNTDLTPRINTKAESFSLYCTASRAIMQVTPDARSQSQSELGADFLTIAVNSARRQLANERYVMALAKVYEVAKNTKQTFDFDAATQLIEKTRSQRWRDFGSFVAQVDQLIANNTMEFGASMVYVGAKGAAQYLSMGSDDFVASGVQARPGIFRLGRYKNRYDVYYTPYVVKETATDIEMLVIGRAAQVARNPVVFSDAVAPTLIPLAVGTDLKNGAALFTRQLTETNPHKASAMGCALITVTNVDVLVP